MKTLELILLILGLVIGFVLLLVLAYYMGKYKNLKPIVFGVAGILIFGFSIYCMADLNYYYNAKGGVFGVLTGLFEVNMVENNVNDLEFSITNIELKQIDGDSYGAKIIINRKPIVDAEKSYYVFVNGIPTTSSEVDTVHAKATYNYSFLDKKMNSMLSDELDMSFAFYENYTTLQITTNGGSDAVKLWNSYFQKQNFKITIEESSLGVILEGK